MRLADVRVPDIDVAARHAGVGRQHEQHRVRARDQVQRQLGLGTDRVQARRVDDDQPQLQQRMRNVDDGMAPGRHLGLTRRRRAADVVVAVVQAHLGGLLGRHQDRLAHRIESLTQRGDVRHVDRDEAPVLVLMTQLGQRHRQQARVDRQQADAHRHRRIIEQLGRAHRRAPGRRGHDALAILRKEDRVDQLRLAARELGHECHLQLGFVQPFDDLRQPGMQPCISQIRLGQPVTIALDGRLQRSPPAAIRLDLLTDAFFSHTGSVHKRGPLRPSAPMDRDATG